MAGQGSRNIGAVAVPLHPNYFFYQDLTLDINCNHVNTVPFTASDPSYVPLSCFYTDLQCCVQMVSGYRANLI